VITQHIIVSDSYRDSNQM